MSWIRNHGLIALLLCCLPWGAASALSSDQDQPIYLEADSVDIDEESGISIYLGNVQLTQGSMRLLADKISVYRKDDRTERIVAIGRPVKFRQRQDDEPEEVTGEALTMEYFVNDEMVHLIGDAVLTQGEDDFRSDRITYYRDRSLVKAGASAEGKERVRAVISPNK